MRNLIIATTAVLTLGIGAASATCCPVNEQGVFTPSGTPIAYFRGPDWLAKGSEECRQRLSKAPLTAAQKSAWSKKPLKNVCTGLPINKQVVKYEP